MIKKRIAMIGLIFTVVAAGLQAQDNKETDRQYTLELLLETLTGTDYEILASDADLEIAVESAKQYMKDKYPRLALNFSGEFGQMLDTNIASDTLDYQSLSAKIRLNQLLPTGGDLSIQLGNNALFGHSDIGDAVLQNPELKVGLSQPIFLNRKIIDFDVYSLRFMAIQQAVKLQEAQRKLDINSAVYDAVSAFFREIFFRKKISQLESYVSIREKEVEADRLLFEQGRISYSDLRDNELSLEDLKKNMMETEYGRMVNYHKLLMKLGLSNTDEIECRNDTFEELIDIDENNLLGTLITQNSDIMIKEFRKTQIESETAQNGLKSAVNLNFNFYLRPAYDTSSPYVPPSELDDSISRLFNSDGVLNWGAGISVNIPLDEISKGRNQNRIDEQNIAKAEIDLQKTRQTVINSFVQLLENRKFLGKRISLISGNISAQEKRLSETEKLYKLEMVTELDLEGVRNSLLEKQNELWEARSLHFLNDLTILSLCGENLLSVKCEKCE